jgi:adenosine deaminase
MEASNELKHALLTKRMDRQAMEALLRALPKAEIHLHIEGTLEPEMAFELAKRNAVTLPYETPQALRSAYNFSNLEDFLKLYYQGLEVLKTKQDFYELAMAYLQRASEENIVRAEVFFDPQAHTSRGVPFASVIEGLLEAAKDAENKLGVSVALILCFLRHLSEQEAFETLKQALPYKKAILGVGLDSSEAGNPPSKFRRVFAMAREEGFLPVAHAGEEGPAGYVREALSELNVLRVDHGVHSEEDPGLMEELKALRIPLSVCPLSNVKLRVFPSLREHNLKRLLDFGLLVTVNSDDPAYFGGYLLENYLQTAEALGMSAWDVFTLAKNSILAAFLPDAEKQRLLQEQGRIASDFL